MENTKEEFELSKNFRWHKIDEDSIPDYDWDAEFVVRLKNGNKRIVYWSCGSLKDRVNGEHIPLDAILLWIQLPKEN